jgi:hypothetical protein
MRGRQPALRRHEARRTGPHHGTLEAIRAVAIEGVPVGESPSKAIARYVFNRK